MATSYHKSMFEVVFTNIEPYIYYDKLNNRESGIIPDIFEFAELFCRKQVKDLTQYTHVLEYKARLNSISDINKLLLSDVEYGEHELENVTSDHAFWFPILKIIDFEDYKKILYHNLTLHHITDVKEFVVIASEKKIHLIYKVYVGLSHATSIAILATIGGICFAFVIWIIERHAKNDFSPTFFRGFGTGSWLAVVTMGTVGYGDITPKTCPGRVVAFFWMIVSVVFSSIMTSTISDTVLGTNSLELYQKKITALRDSPEALSVKFDYDGTLFPAGDIKDMVNLLENHTVEYGLLNGDIAAYHQDQFYGANKGDESMEQLVFIYSVPVKVPLEFLVNVDNPIVKKYISCFELHRDEIVPSILAKYKKHLRYESIHHISATKLFKQYPYVTYFSGILAAFIGVGFVYELHLWLNKPKIILGGERYK